MGFFGAVGGIDESLTFELRRTDGGEKSIIRYLEQLLKDVPLEGPRVKTDLVKAFLEDRE